MPMQDAINLIRTVAVDQQLRKEAYMCANGSDFSTYLEGRGYSFKPWEFEDAFTSLLLKARDEEDAEKMWEIKHWYEFMKAL